MRSQLAVVALALAVQLGAVSAQQAAPAAGEAEPLLTGSAAFGDWTKDRPGLRRKITTSDLPAPYATRSAGNGPAMVKAPSGARLKVPPGFSVEPFLTGLSGPRLMRRAPNGDIFLAEGAAGRIKVIRTADAAPAPEKVEVFAKGLAQPFGIGFYPPGPDPKWVYVADTDAILRFPYGNGDLVARGQPEPVVRLPISEGGHWTRDLVFSPDGQRLYVSIGSQSDAAEDMRPGSRKQQARFLSGHALGAAWGEEENRADVLVFDPQGRDERVFATGLRNCVGLALHPQSGDLWCSTNERDGLGDDLPPDYVTRVKEGGFYGWPWYYLGANEDPRHRGERRDLAKKVALPDVLLQAHSAPLAMTFYEAGQTGPAAFPKDYEGDAFIALHGSWNRSRRTGYKVVRIKLDRGVPRGEYQDFLTGFVADQASVWGRPVGVVVARDGALLVSEDGNDSLWRVAWRGAK
ncbi:Glucose/arabinose dehydrogenase, beta-propeller fold [Rhizobiales bacterium GAS113]|nr:Glucose/arabinose dehydrogenase, beta-propeller fold [Rhizobiales bacterium GAS113]